MFNHLNEALDWLYAQKKLKKREDLSRITTCIKELKIQKNYKIIHIAGTNGKGSTACFIKNMVASLGYKVGFFVSPYVLCFNERIQVGQEFISDEKVIHYCNLLYDYAKKYQQQYEDTIPFFELTYLMALFYFQEMNIEYAVIECGLGGRLDATNSMDSDVSVITNIGYDHMAQLGNQLEEIAFHKLGITRSNHPCFTAVHPKLQAFFKEYAIKNSIPMHFIYQEVMDVKSDDILSFSFRGKTYYTKMNAYYQAWNASLAISVIEYLFPEISYEEMQKVLSSTTWPGRFEEICPQVILDGAHNIDGIIALVESIKQKYPTSKIKVVFTALHDKAIDQMLHLLDEIAEQYYFTTIEDKRATKVTYFETFTSKPYELIPDYRQAIGQAYQSLKQDEILLITGSLHFISMARILFK